MSLQPVQTRVEVNRMETLAEVIGRASAEKQILALDKAILNLLVVRWKDIDRYNETLLGAMSDGDCRSVLEAYNNDYPSNTFEYANWLVDKTPYTLAGDLIVYASNLCENRTARKYTFSVQGLRDEGPSFFAIPPTGRFVELTSDQSLESVERVNGIEMTCELMFSNIEAQAQAQKSRPVLSEGMQ
jgi:hypothetical protein